jgi:hypothetical protein
MEQIFERLEAIMDAHYEKMRATIGSGQEQLIAKLKADREEMTAWGTETKACREATETCEGNTEAFLKKKESAPEEPKAVAQTEEVPEGATDEEAIGVTEDRSRNLCLAVRCRGRLKTRTKFDGRLRQDCAATVGRPTRRFVPALRKGGLPKGPGKKCRSGIKGPSRTLGSRMEDGGLKQQRIKDNVVRGAHKERTHPVFENGIRNQGARKSILRTNGGRVSEAFRHKFETKAVKIAVVSPIGLREPGDCLLWKCRPPPKRKR